MDRRVTPTRRVTSFTRGFPPPLKQALNKFVLYGVIGHLPVECGERGMRSSKEGEDLQYRLLVNFELSCAVFLIKENMTIVFFFLRGHGNESCNLIGS